MTCGVTVNAEQALIAEIRSARRRINDKKRHARKVPERMEVLQESERAFTWALALLYSEREHHIWTTREIAERVAPVCNGRPGVSGVDHDLGPCPLHGDDGTSDPPQLPSELLPRGPGGRPVG